MSQSHAFIIGTTAPAGSGKTYRPCAHYLYEEWLPGAGRTHWSNFPVKVDELLGAYAERAGVPVPSLQDRVKLIPAEVLATWTGDRPQSGPWDFFNGVDLTGCR